MMPENTLFVKGMLFIIILIYSKASLGTDMTKLFKFTQAVLKK